MITRTGKSRALWLGVTCGMLLVGSACNSKPPFPGGIRVYAYIAPEESPTQGIGVGGVLDTGEWIIYNGTPQQSHGTQFSFEGLTSGNGVDDHPNASDNSTWYLTADFSAPTGNQCTSNDTTVSVPPGGYTANVACSYPPH
jgi:hypothetical protein